MKYVLIGLLALASCNDNGGTPTEDDDGDGIPDRAYAAPARGGVDTIDTSAMDSMKRAEYRELKGY